MTSDITKRYKKPSRYSRHALAARLWILIALALSVALVPSFAYADPSDEITDGAPSADDVIEVMGAPEQVSLEGVPLADSDELLDQYIEEQFGAALPEDAAGYVDPERTTTSLAEGTNERALLDLLKGRIASVAAGQLTSTEFNFQGSDLASLFTKYRYTSEELGLSTIFDGNSISEEAQSTLFQKLMEQQDIDLVLHALLADCPQEMYWFDKRDGMTFGFSYGIYTRNGVETIYVSDFHLVFSVDSAYAVPGVTSSYSGSPCQINPSTGTLVSGAVAKAQEIAGAHTDYAAYERLEAFKDDICTETSYNYEARDAEEAHNATTIDPWQLIWVFDEDPDTEVVCEGYAKAFQYLCELADIDDVTCRSVTGTMGGGTGAGAHMWNIVNMDDGKNYLVDVTNCDEDTVGYPDELFMKPPASGSASEGYTFTNTTPNMTYQYDTGQEDGVGDMFAVFTETDLTLSMEDYVAPEVPQPTDAVVYNEINVTSYMDEPAYGGSVNDSHVVTIDEEGVVSSGGWYCKDNAGQWVPYTQETFTTGTYRYQYVFSVLLNGDGSGYSFADPVYVVINGVASLVEPAIIPRYDTNLTLLDATITTTVYSPEFVVERTSVNITIDMDGHGEDVDLQLPVGEPESTVLRWGSVFSPADEPKDEGYKFVCVAPGPKSSYNSISELSAAVRGALSQGNKLQDDATYYAIWFETIDLVSFSIDQPVVGTSTATQKNSNGSWDFSTQTNPPQVTFTSNTYFNEYQGIVGAFWAQPEYAEPDQIVDIPWQGTFEPRGSYPFETSFYASYGYVFADDDYLMVSAQGAESAVEVTSSFFPFFLMPTGSGGLSLPVDMPISIAMIGGTVTAPSAQVLSAPIRGALPNATSLDVPVTFKNATTSNKVGVQVTLTDADNNDHTATKTVALTEADIAAGSTTVSLDQDQLGRALVEGDEVSILVWIEDGAQNLVSDRYKVDPVTVENYSINVTIDMGGYAQDKTFVWEAGSPESSILLWGLPFDPSSNTAPTAEGYRFVTVAPKPLDQYNSMDELANDIRARLKANNKLYEDTTYYAIWFEEIDAVSYSIAAPHIGDTTATGKDTYGNWSFDTQTNPPVATLGEGHYSDEFNGMKELFWATFENGNGMMTPWEGVFAPRPATPYVLELVADFGYAFAPSEALEVTASGVVESETLTSQSFPYWAMSQISYMPDDVQMPYSMLLIAGSVDATGDFADTVIAPIATQNYTGKALTPKPTVTLGSYTLAEGEDYTLSYINNVKAGTATVTVTGKGGLSGSKSATFAIREVWVRRSGQVALDTMQAIAGEFGKAGVAVVTTNAGFKDALAASCLAGRHNALVLTTPKDKVAPQTRAALKAAGVKTVYLVGSTSDVTAATERALKSGTGVTKVVRISGASPSAKAVAVAKACGKRSDTVIIATQVSFKDALSIAPYSYATKSPILYAETNKSLSAATLKYIKDSRFSKAIIVGGPVALPASIDAQLTKSAGIKSANITRLAGGDSYATSEVIARWATGQYANGQTVGAYQGKALAYVRSQPAARMSANRLAVATSQGWKDALCGSALCGKSRSVLLLADDKTAKSNWARACGFCSEQRASVTRAYVFGGTSAVSARVWDALLASTAL